MSEYLPQDVRGRSRQKYCNGPEIISNNKIIYNFNYSDKKDDDASKVQLTSNKSRFVNYLLNKR